MDPAQRVPTLGVFAVILLGVPVYYATVGRRATNLGGGKPQ